MSAGLLSFPKRAACVNPRAPRWAPYASRTPTEINLVFCFKLAAGLMVIFFNQLSVKLYKKIPLEPLGSLCICKECERKPVLCVTFFYLTLLTVMCFYVFGMSETYNLANILLCIRVYCAWSLWEALAGPGEAALCSGGNADILLWMLLH